MFEDTPTQDKPKGQTLPTKGKQPEDIFAETEKAAAVSSAGVKKSAPPQNIPTLKTIPEAKAETKGERVPEPTPPTIARPPDQPSPFTQKEEKEGKPPPAPEPAATPTPPTLTLDSSGFGRKRWVLISLVVIGIIALGALGWWVLRLNKSEPLPKPPVELETEPEPEVQPEETTVLPPETQEEQESEVRFEFPNLPPDRDADGLPDAEEARLGTNPVSSDSDGDGLYDREEVKVWKTDPTNPDTDGDGFQDGEEVDNGYDPNGAGKLLDIRRGVR